MMEAVHRYEGTVNQVMGDGIMALFGAPLAHEDHAVRACYAALRMQESVKRYAVGVRREHGASVRIRGGSTRAIEALHQERPGGEIERLAHHALHGELERSRCATSARPGSKRPRGRRSRTPERGSSRRSARSMRCPRADPCSSSPSRFASSCGRC